MLAHVTDRLLKAKVKLEAAERQLLGIFTAKGNAILEKTDHHFASHSTDIHELQGDILRFPGAEE